MRALLACLLVACLFLGGCAAQPVPYHPGTEIPQGAGLLTGEDGTFVLSAEEWRQFQEWKKTKK